MESFQPNDMDQVDILKDQVAFMVREKIPLTDATAMFKAAYVRQAVANTATRNRPRGNLCQAAKDISTHRNTLTRHLPRKARERGNRVA